MIDLYLIIGSYFIWLLLAILILRLIGLKTLFGNYLMIANHLAVVVTFIQEKIILNNANSVISILIGFFIGLFFIIKFTNNKNLFTLPKPSLHFLVFLALTYVLILTIVASVAGLAIFSDQPDKHKLFWGMNYPILKACYDAAGGIAISASIIAMLGKANFWYLPIIPFAIDAITSGSKSMILVIPFTIAALIQVNTPFKIIIHKDIWKYIGFITLCFLVLYLFYGENLIDGLLNRLLKAGTGLIYLDGINQSKIEIINPLINLFPGIFSKIGFEIQSIGSQLKYIFSGDDSGAGPNSDIFVAGIVLFGNFSIFWGILVGLIYGFINNYFLKLQRGLWVYLTLPIVSTSHSIYIDFSSWFQWFTRYCVGTLIIIFIWSLFKTIMLPAKIKDKKNGQY